MRAVSALFQPGRRGQTLHRAPRGRAGADRFGNPVPGCRRRVAAWWRAGVEVSWAETLSGPPTGSASVTWTLGGGIGVQKVTATVPGATGSPVTFSVPYSSESGICSVLATPVAVDCCN